MNKYCRRLPHLDLVLSEIKPIIGSVIASKILGTRKTNDHIHPEKLRSSIKTTIKIPRIAGNICMASIPKPKAIFWPMGTLTELFILLVR